MPVRRFRSKKDWVEGAVRGRRVLDLGCVDHSLDRVDRPWLHDAIVTLAHSVVGVDLLPEPVAELQDRGYDVRVGDVQQLELGETFDVVVAGDIVEHLANPGGLFESAARHLCPDGLLLISTPNPFTLRRFVQILIRGRAAANGEHTVWFSDKVLVELAHRCGFELVAEDYLDDAFHSLSITTRWRHARRKGRAGLGHALGLAARGLVWLPLRIVDALLVRVRARMCESLCMTFRPAGDHDAVVADPGEATCS